MCMIQLPPMCKLRDLGNAQNSYMDNRWMVKCVDKPNFYV